MRVATIRALAVGLMATACPGAQVRHPADPQPMSVAGPYRHLGSGLTFPTGVGSFRRVNVMRWDREGRHVSVGYNCDDPRHPVVATTYVLMAPEVGSFLATPENLAATRSRVLDEAYEAPKREVLATYPGARLVQEGEAPAPFGDGKVPGRLAVFEFDRSAPERPPPACAILACSSRMPSPGKLAWQLEAAGPKSA